MFRKLAIAGILACALPLLGGCATDPITGKPVLPTIPSIDPATVTQVQSLATSVCGFVPTISTVASIIATFAGGGAAVDLISQAANGICKAVSAKSLRRGGALPSYRGVVIEGYRVR